MATYVLGDIHGCYRTLETLLDRIPFREKKDRLWLVGDLVNRGPRSLKTLRWAFRRQQELGKRFVVVLGNHDLHLLACADGLRKQRGGDTLERILSAKDRKDLLGWLKSCPLLYTQLVEDRRVVLVHAGLDPSWSLRMAREAADRIGNELAAHGTKRLFDGSREGKKWTAMRADLSALTRIRCCDKAGRPIDWSGTPEDAPNGAVPWFEHSLFRPPKNTTFVFGHWAALGQRNGAHWTSLDTGVIWRGSLTAIRLEDGEIFRAKARE